MRETESERKRERVCVCEDEGRQITHIEIRQISSVLSLKWKILTKLIQGRVE